MKLLSYYIYAIRGIWMDRYKIGYYIGDLKTLKKRYSTYYGAQLELYIFEINCDKLMAQGIERNIFKRMKTYKCGIGELYYATCLDWGRVPQTPSITLNFFFCFCLQSIFFLISIKAKYVCLRLEVKSRKYIEKFMLSIFNENHT